MTDEIRRRFAAAGALVLGAAALVTVSCGLRMVVLTGVPNLGCILAKNWGKSPSWAIVNKMRGCPSNRTRTTEVNPAMAPSFTKAANHPIPVASAAMAIGSATLSLV